MKFATLTAIVFGAVACLAVQGDLMPASQCNNGNIQCCNELKKYSELDLKERNEVTNIVGGVVDALHGQFGVDCTSVSVLGLAGNQCNAQTVCCHNVESSALISISCVPININL